MFKCRSELVRNRFDIRAIASCLNEDFHVVRLPCLQVFAVGVGYGFGEVGKSAPTAGFKRRRVGSTIYPIGNHRLAP